MNKLVITTTCLLGLLFTSISAQASNYPSYSYIQATTQSWELFNSNDITGPGAILSIELGDTLFVTAEAFRISIKESAGAFYIEDEFEVGSLGLGIRSSTVNKTSWYLSLSQEKWNWDTTDNLFGATYTDTIKPERSVLIIGFRSQISRSVELNGSIQRYHLDLKNGDEFDDSETSNGNAIQLGLGYQFIEDLHLVLDYSKSQSDVEYERLSLGLRYSF